MKKRKILITPTLLIALAFLLVFCTNARAEKIEEESIENLNELNQLTYQGWIEEQNQKIKDLEFKVNKMTEERFNKMIEMQKEFNQAELEKVKSLRNDLNFFS